MTFNKILMTAAAAIIAGALGHATPVLADPPSWAHGHGHDDAVSADRDDDRDDHDRHEEHHDDDHHHHHHGHDVRLVEHDRVVLREYIGHHRDKWCPPGLAKKHNGCMPPGHLRYEVGARIPETVHYDILPRDVLHTLTPLPPDEMYVRTGTDVYVMSKTDRTILDAVTLLNDLR